MKYFVWYKSTVHYYEFIKYESWSEAVKLRSDFWEKDKEAFITSEQLIWEVETNYKTLAAVLEKPLRHGFHIPSTIETAEEAIVYIQENF